MKRFNFKNLVIIVLITVVCGLFYFGGGARAEESSLNQKLSDTKDSVNELLELKDNDLISPQEKEKMEISIRKKIILKVIDLSKSQLIDLQKKLDSAKVPDSDDWKLVKEDFAKKTESFIKYYDESDKFISEGGDISLEEIKSLAKKIEDKKAGEIDPEVKKMNNVVVIFGISDILGLVDERFNKIKLDINKVYEKKLVKDQSLMDLFKKSSTIIEESRALSDKSKEVVLNIYSDQSATTTKEFIKGLKEEIFEGIESKLDKNDSEKSDKNASSTESAIESAEDVSWKEIDSYLNDLIINSLGGVRQAYEVFIKMSLNIKKFIQ